MLFTLTFELEDPIEPVEEGRDAAKRAAEAARPLKEAFSSPTFNNA